MFNRLSALVVIAVLGAPAVHGLEDPTRPPMVQRAAVKPQRYVPQLKSILVSETRRLALIDDRVMAEGDKFDGLALLRVDHDAVQLRIASGEHITLRLTSNKIRKERR